MLLLLAAGCACIRAFHLPALLITVATTSSVGCGLSASNISSASLSTRCRSRFSSLMRGCCSLQTNVTPKRVSSLPTTGVRGHESREGEFADDASTEEEEEGRGGRGVFVALIGDNVVGRIGLGTAKLPPDRRLMSSVCLSSVPASSLPLTASLSPTLTCFGDCADAGLALAGSDDELSVGVASVDATEGDRVSERVAGETTRVGALASAVVSLLLLRPLAPLINAPFTLAAASVDAADSTASAAIASVMTRKFNCNRNADINRPRARGEQGVGSGRERVSEERRRAGRPRERERGCPPLALTRPTNHNIYELSMCDSECILKCE